MTKPDKLAFKGVGWALFGVVLAGGSFGVYYQDLRIFLTAALAVMAVLAFIVCVACFFKASES